MWYSQINRRSSEHGLTLIEMVVVAPLIILLIGTIIVMLSNLTGDSLYTQEKNTSAYNVQSALDDMEVSIRLSTAFYNAILVDAPFGRDDELSTFVSEAGSSPDNAGYDVLLLKSVATDLSPYDSNRQLIYDGPGACDSNNPLHWYIQVYFVDTTTKTLHKRTILQDSTMYIPTPSSTPPCATPYQRSSCAAGEPSPCMAKDEILLDNISDMEITYYEQPSSPTPQALTTIPDAQVASITITRGTEASGEDITYSGTVRAARLNISNGD